MQLLHVVQFSCYYQSYHKQSSTVTYTPISEINEAIGDNVPLVSMIDLTPCDRKSSIA